MVVVAASLAVLSFMVLGSYFKYRTFVIQAQTSLVDLTFVGNANVWYLPSAMKCSLREEPVLSIASGNPSCDARFYEQQAIENYEVQWPAGALVRITRLGNGAVVLSVENYFGNTIELAVGTKILIAAEELEQVGILTFAAEMMVGTQLGSGERHYLSNGEWEARDKGFATHLFRSNVTEVVKSGRLEKGTTATVWIDQRVATMYGHIGPIRFAGKNYLEVGALSETGDVELRLGYFGQTKPVVIKPNLIDVAITSPLLFAIAIVLSLLASASQVYADTISRSKTPVEKL